ncbi:MAG: hypothetical protein IJW05_12390 [Lentisphaeria bacterium]|nr:hypothetical protein [Lentisphaeria bacterium]
MKILKIMREYDSVSAIISDDGRIERRIFPSKMTDEEIKCAVMGIEYTGVKKEKAPKDEVKDESEPVNVAPKKLHEEISDKRTAKAQMLKVLKEHGIDTAGLLTFTAVEEVYHKHFKDGVK